MANFILPCDPNDAYPPRCRQSSAETRDWIRQQQRKLLRLEIVHGEKIPEPRGTGRDGER